MMRNRWIRLTCLGMLLMGTTLVTAQEIRCYHWNPASTPRERWVDFEELRLDIAIDPYAKKVEGTATFSLRSLRPTLDSLWLDGPGIEILEARWDDQPIRFQTEAKGTAFFPEPIPTRLDIHTLTIRYRAFPKKGMYFTGWQDKERTTGRQVWTQGQGIDNRHWFPHFDDMSDKLRMEMQITFPKPFPVLSNGRLAGTRETDSTQTWHYVMEKPHASYLTMIGAGDYAIDSARSASGVPIQMWYYPDQPHKKEPTYYKTREMVDFFENYLEVPYPWQKYAQIPVRNFLYGAMENTTATVFSESFYVDSREFPERNYVFVNAHEFAHQWFGNLVTSRSSEAHWLHESFATYFHALWQGEVFGQEAWESMMNGFRQTALEAGEKDTYPISDGRAGSARHYMKGAFVLRMLHDQIGDTLFRAGLKHYLETHAHRNVNSEDLLRAFHEATGLPLDAFWDQWVYRGGEPHIRVTSNAGEKGKESLQIQLEQLQDTVETVRNFSLPMEVVIHHRSGTDRVQFSLDGDTTLIFSQFKAKQVQFIEVDPQRKLLARWDMEQSEAAWKAQALTGSHWLSRHQAWDRYGPSAEESVKAWEEAWKKEPSREVRTNMLAFLPDDPEVRAALKEDVLGSDQAAWKLVWIQSDPMETWDSTYLTLLQDSSYSVIQTTLNLLAVSFPDRLPELLLLSAPSSLNNADLRIEWLTWKHIMNPGEYWNTALITFATDLYDYQVRLHAIRNGLEIGLWKDDWFLETLVLARQSFNRRLRSGTCTAIRTYAKEHADFQQYWETYVREHHADAAEELEGCIK